MFALNAVQIVILVSTIIFALVVNKDINLINKTNVIEINMYIYPYIHHVK
jgi:hypothetical protein